MDTRTTDPSRQQKSHEFSKKLLKLTIVGGVAFWATTVVISLTPIRAEFRAAFSMSYVLYALIEPLLGGLIISCFVSYLLLRFFDKVPTKNPILKSLMLSSIPYVINIILLGVAATITSNAQYVFLIGAALQVPTYLILGIAIGYAYHRLEAPGANQIRDRGPTKIQPPL